MKKIVRGILFWILALGAWINPFPLHGQGIPHFNTISWTVSTSTEVTSQKVYRSTVSGGPYTLLATIPNNTAASYQDSSVTIGANHCYVLTALAGTSESMFSSEVCAVDKGTNVNPQTGAAVVSQ